MAYDPSDWDTADDTAKVTAQYFWTDAEGAHVSLAPGYGSLGQNMLLKTDGLRLRYNTTENAKFLDYMAQIGSNNTSHMEIYANGMNMFIGYTDDDDIYQLIQALSMYFNQGQTNDYAHIDAPSSGLWLGAEGGNITVASKDGDSSAAVRLRGGKMQVVNESGSTLWTGTAQQMADALNYKSTAPRIYNGNFVKNVGSSNTQRTQIWNDATFCSTFNVSSGHVGDCAVCFSNTNYNAGNLGAVGSEYVPSGGWYAHWTANATGNKQFGYLIVVPAAYSTV